MLKIFREIKFLFHGIFAEVTQELSKINKTLPTPIGNYDKSGNPTMKKENLCLIVAQLFLCAAELSYMLF